MHRLYGRVMASCALAAGVGIAHAQSILFSHDVGTTGLSPSAVFSAPDTSDVFGATMTLGGPPAPTNTLVHDNPLAFGLQPGDNMDALSNGGANVLQGAAGIFLRSFVFSVAPGAIGQPGTLINFRAPWNAADVYIAANPGHVIGAVAQALWLDDFGNPIESIDGLTLRPGALGAGQRAFFSLTPGSPTLLAQGWSAADVLTCVIGVPGTLQRAILATDLGLLAGDDLDALFMIETIDIDGDGALLSANDQSIVFFSVSNASSGAAGTGVAQQAVGNGAGGDVFMSGIAGGNVRVLDNVFDALLDPADELDALDELRNSNGVPPFIYGGVLPDPPTWDPPNNGPPYVPPASPLGGAWIGICDVPLPGRINVDITAKLCDPNGNQVKVNLFNNIRGFAGGNALVKAIIMANSLSGMKLTKPNGDEIPIFSGVSIGPPAHFPQSNIVFEVCVVVNQDVLDCGFGLDALCISFSNWTATIIPIPCLMPDGDPWPGFRVYGLEVLDAPEEDGLFRVAFGEPSLSAPPPTEYATEFLAGQLPDSFLLDIVQQIELDGGDARLVPPGRFEVASTGVEPLAPTEGGGLGPYLYEGGAPMNFVRVTIDAKLTTERIVYEEPCIGDWDGSGGQPNSSDFLAYLNDFAELDPRADLAPPGGDGLFNSSDFLAFLNFYVLGC